MTLRPTAFAALAALGALSATPGLARAADPDPVLGRRLYDANCTACHGAAGDGKGAAAIALTPKPTDFTQAAWWQGKDDAALVASIRSGRPGTSMTPFTALSEADLANVVAYVRTFAAPKP